MAKKLMAIPLALAVVLGAQVAVYAADTNGTDPNYDNKSVGVDRNDVGGGGGGIRADYIKGATETQIADLPAGHWATYATQIAVANNLLAMENSQFMGDRELTADELHHAMESLVNTSENIAGKGALTDLRAELGTIPTGSQAVSRLELAQVIGRFLDAANKAELVAVGASQSQASSFKDLTSVPPAVVAVVDKYKIMAGFADHTFRPNTAMTRYQMAAIGKQVLDFMRQAPIAQTPMAPVIANNPTVIVVPPNMEEPIVIPAAPQSRKNYRQNAPIALSWQALNQDNLSNLNNNQGYGAFSVVPVSGQFTGYQGPVMLQNVTNFRYNVYQDNLVDSEFRVGYANLKYGQFQLIPYVGANVGIGASIPSSATQYDTYVGATYGGIVSWLPMSNLELHASAGQAALLGAGRFDSNFSPVAYPSALGSFLTNYGVGADFYVQPNIALTLGLSNWQTPADLRTATSSYQAGLVNTLGGNVGVGFRF
ncbi:MAG: hypothetical protein JWM80_5401 [Cyanobacteria bacterium RYN_339]|nr:hypothetical protein [Cyanobacteria bacterium RYN_339]